MKKVWLEKDESPEPNDVVVEDGGNDNGEVTSQDNNIFFYNGVNVNNILSLKKKILKINKSLKIIQDCYDIPQESLRIKLHLHTPGGDGYSAFNMVDFMRRNPYKIDTYAEGICASAGTIISMAGDKRYISENAYFLIHQLRGCVWGKFCDIKDETYNYELFHKKLIDFYIKKSKIDRENVEKLIMNERFFESHEALELGLVDENI